MDHTIESYVGMRLETAQGEIMGVIGIIHDRPLTQEDGSIVKAVLGQIGARVANELDRLRIETNLIYARDVAESTAKNKTKFLADMSHEIRNPMNAVVGVTDILLDTAGLSDEQAGYIEVIRTSGQHLLTVINDILDISRIDQDVKFLLERRPLSLRKCLKDAVSLAGLTPLHDVSRSISVIEWPPEMDDLGPFTELEETNILPLLWSIDHDVPEHLLGDITRLRQVLINLCTNSLKFTRRGRVSVHVSIHNPTAQHPTIPPNCPSIVSRNSPHGSQAGDVSSLPSSPMLTGNDHRTQMVFQQRYDVNVKADGNNAGTAHAKVPTATTRRRPADKRHVALMAAGPPTSHDQSSSSSTPPSLTVVAPTANSLEGDKLDENTVILEFAVSDTGVGIPANKITELFTSFSQVDISVSTRFGGTGLGLAISAGLVEKMGGNIWVESTEGVGSRFTFTIPFTVCQSSETDSHPSVTAPSSPVSTHERYESANRGNLDTFTLPASINSTSGSTQEEAGKEKANENEKQKSRAQIPAPKEVAQPAGSPKSSMPTYAKMVESSLKPLTINGIPLRILLAEDNAVNQTIAVGVLKKLGYENVDVAQNGLEVIDKLDNGSVYDVILMDVSMPVMDGIDATKTIVERRRRGLLAAAESLAQTQTDKLDPDNKGASATLATPPTDTTAVSSIYKDYLNLYVIALTASAMGSDKERCMEAGMDDFMTKPFALLEMKRVLNGYVSNWNSGALRARNEACLSAALALRNQCHSPNCQSALSSLNSHSLTPTLGRSCSATSSNASLVDSGAGECAGCGQVLSTNDGNSTDGTSGILSASPTSPQSRTCRMETPRPLRRNLEGLGCGLFTAGRRSQSEILISGQTSGSALLGPMALETPSLPRRASDAFSFVKRDWRSGLGTNSEQSSGNGVHDVHPLDTSHSDQNPDPEHGHHSNSAFQPSHLRVKRVMSPSNLSKEYDTSDCKPMASPLSPLSLLTTDTEGSSSVSPPLSSSSTSSLTETQARSDEMLLGSGRFSLDSSDAASTKDADSTSKVDMAHETQPSLAVA
ncbi:hypothetical protein BC939DRAFT_140136 [Gamsiella multidivaricata]|uniref:uncharacterized protein n=1 Tax=Gamsiella multidivaricata TaxID=101098 RepID=UPI00221E7A42|nr:uncharacterized protein BC939DRAFT_140136 [Gamsiella multidivaricata]KAI7824716.1 hypothetical protein BC939DRAFT_140136 [Gamsiella multidivaricata]